MASKAKEIEMNKQIEFLKELKALLEMYSVELAACCCDYLYLKFEDTSIKIKPSLTPLNIENHLFKLGIMRWYSREAKHNIDFLTNSEIEELFFLQLLMLLSRHDAYIHSNDAIHVTFKKDKNISYEFSEFTLDCFHISRMLFRRKGLQHIENEIKNQ